MELHVPVVVRVSRLWLGVLSLKFHLFLSRSAPSSLVSLLSGLLPFPDSHVTVFHCLGHFPSQVSTFLAPACPPSRFSIPVFFFSPLPVTATPASSSLFSRSLHQRFFFCFTFLGSLTPLVPMATSPGQARQRPNRHRCLRRAQKKSCSRDDTGAGVSSAGGISLSASGKRRTKFPQSRVRGTHPKLRQREQQEIRELEDRICVEMPLPGLCWTPPVLSTCEGRTPVNASSGSPEEDTTRRQLKEVSTHQTAKPATRDQEEAPKDRNEGGMEGRGNVSTSTDEGQDATERIEQAGVPVLSKFFFSDLPLSGYTRRGLQEAGFHRLSSIQFRVIPHALRGADVLGEAKTGSGKTLCFVVPVSHGDFVRSL